MLLNSSLVQLERIAQTKIIMTEDEEMISVTETEGFITTTFSSRVKLSVRSPRSYLVEYDERCGRLLVAGSDNILLISSDSKELF